MPLLYHGSMIDIFLLEKLDAFARLGTLSAASEELHISQPALTRSMQQLENLLGVTLFDRQKNRLYLNDTGRLAAQLASGVLHADQSFEDQVLAYDRRLRTISLGCCAPVPSYVLVPALQRIYEGMTIASTVSSDEDALRTGLLDGTYQLVVLHDPWEDKRCFSMACGHEKLSISVPPAHPLAAFDTVSFADLEDVPILLYAKVGFWYDLVSRKIPHPHFLQLEDFRTFNEIADTSALSTFVTDYSIENLRKANPSRKIIQISDPEATATYRIVCTVRDKGRFLPFFTHLPDWCRR